MSESAPENQILIIKRGKRGGGDGHHGGVWKIAYADFMTAMMAFFLVMWLVNAANEKTKTQVASYFNPIKLIDTRTNKKGLQSMDTGDGESWDKKDPAGAHQKDEDDQKKGGMSSSPTDNPKSEQISRKKLDSKLAVVERSFHYLADGKGTDAKETDSAPQKSANRESVPTVSNQKPEKEPFDFFELLAAQQSSGANQQQGKEPDKEPKTKDKAAGGLANSTTIEKTPDSEGNATGKDLEKVSSDKHKLETGDIPDDQPNDAQPKPERVRKETVKVSKPVDPFGNLKREVHAIGSQLSEGGMNVSIADVDGGALISLTEGAKSPMFAIATAEPSKELTGLIGKIGQAVENVPGKIVIRGHTDGRVYNTELADNWSLSADRAHTAYKLLVGAGVKSKRFERIEGYADTRLINASDPLHAANRRVEIFIIRQGQN